MLAKTIGINTYGFAYAAAGIRRLLFLAIYQAENLTVVVA
jgi:hypothetical protein